MEGMKLGFIGAGNMASAILGGVLRQNLFSPQDIFVSDPQEEKQKALQGLGVRVTAENRAVAAWADLLILAIKPQMFDGVLEELSDEVAGKCVISIAPGISSGYLAGRLRDAHVVRVMPNTPLLVGRGATAIAQVSGVPEEVFQMVLQIFSASGEVAVLPEEQMDAIVAVNGSSPAFFFRMADAMVRTAADQGIDPDVALRLAARTMEGAAAMLLEGGKTAGELTRQVCSPGGTTLAALTAFDEYRFEEMMAQAMERCTKRAIELGK